MSKPFEIIQRTIQKMTMKRKDGEVLGLIKEKKKQNDLYHTLK